MCIQRPSDDQALVSGDGYLSANAWVPSIDLEETCPHGVKYSTNQSDVDVCEDCREYYGSLQAEGSVGK